MLKKRPGYMGARPEEVRRYRFRDWLVDPLLNHLYLTYQKKGLFVNN